MATLLGVSKSTVRKMADRGLLRCWRTREGGHLRFSEADDRWRDTAAAYRAPHPLPHPPAARQAGPRHTLARTPQAGVPLCPVSHSASIYSALMELGRTQPHIVIADLDAASERDFAIVHSIRNDESLRKSFVLLLGNSEQGLAAQNQIKGYVSYFPGDDYQALVKAIRVFGLGFSLV
jgi:excisionase family DNA binding protein